VVLRGHQKPVLAVDISPDSRWLVTGSSDRSARLWDLTAADPASTSIPLRGHEAEVTVLSAGSQLVTVANNGTVRRWDMDPAAWRARACTIAGRNLTQAEWQRYLPDMPLKTIRTKKWKLTYYAGKPYGELYDLENDPKEFTNLYGQEKYRDIQENLKQILLDELILTEGRLPEQVAAH